MPRQAGGQRFYFYKIYDKRETMEQVIILPAQLSRFDEVGKQPGDASAWKRRERFNLTYAFIRDR
jgi:hypothetical protein